MADREDAAMVFRHLLSGAAVHRLTQTKGGLLIAEGTPGRASALDTPTSQIELRGAGLTDRPGSSTWLVEEEQFTRPGHECPVGSDPNVDLDRLAAAIRQLER
jgi:hypothetical protein